MAKDYSYLEGKKFTYNDGRFEYDAVVLYADYDIGLTCVSTYDSNIYAICLRGMSSSNPSVKQRKSYQYIWAGMIRQIEQGYVDVNKSMQLFGRHTGKIEKGSTRLSSNNCAFGQ